MEESIDIPEKAQGKIKDLVRQKNMIDSTINSYAQGIIDSLGYDGDWMIDPTYTKFIRPVKKGD